MKRQCVITAIALLAAAGVRAQSVAGSMNSNGSSQPIQRSAPKAPPGQTMQTSTGDGRDRLLEGCVRNTHGDLTLTDVEGKIYHLRGDTAPLAHHIGQHATVTGTEEPGTSGGAGAQPIFTVKKVPLIASTCAASK
jgi:hypothetical protein